MPPRRGKKRKAADLNRSAVGSAARERYDAALLRFDDYCTRFGFDFNPARKEEADEICAGHVQALYDDDCPMAWAGDFLSAMTDRWPALRGHLHASWRHFSAWKRLEPPQRAKPAARACVRVWIWVLIFCLNMCNYEIILPTLCHIVLVFSLLRPSEVRGLNWSDVTFDFSTAVPPALICQISIDHSKTSIRKHATESVTLTDPFVVFLLRLAAEHATTEKVWPFNAGFFN